MKVAYGARREAPGASSAGETLQSSRVSVVIADTQPLFRNGLRRLLEGHDDFSILGEAGDGRHTLRLVRNVEPDVLVLDIATRRCSGFEVLGELQRAHPGVKTLLVASTIDTAQKIHGLQLGIRGIVRKDTPSHLLLKSIRLVAAGDYWIERRTVADLVKALADGYRPRRTPQSNRWSITKREREILAYVVGGYGNNVIARKCGISEDTVKDHLSSILDKTGSSGRLELALFAIHHQLVKRSEPRRLAARPATTTTVVL
jgi:two-component system nitrate/nitrite response regulator NarL